jgi:predicted DCC family thiol-disulfide oxidoreductase YuxK
MHRTRASHSIQDFGEAAGASHATIIFDGFCNFCVGAVNFIIKRDHRRHFRFATVQSPIGAGLLREHNLRFEQLQSFVLIENGRVYQRSTAALRVARRLKGLWPLFNVFLIVPAPLRNAGYAMFSRRRYSLFGKRVTCMLPTPEMMESFLKE